uniref:Uncharacterized protein n=1 Tax=Cyanistes caeruleus TaxID=156563 RepID=A0A8C0Z7K0_CYACU
MQQHPLVPAAPLPQRCLGGIISLISPAVLSCERYCTMTRTTEADTTNYRKTWTGIILSWTYSLLWALSPLFGWSSYGPEGPGITCSVNWHSKDANNASHIICLFIFCLVIPFAIIVCSCGKLLCAVRQVSQLSCEGLCRAQAEAKRGLLLSWGIRSTMQVCPGTQLGQGVHLCFLGLTTMPQGMAGGGCAPHVLSHS